MKLKTQLRLTLMAMLLALAICIHNSFLILSLEKSIKAINVSCEKIEERISVIEKRIK